MYRCELTVPHLWMTLQQLQLALLESPGSGAVASLHANATLAFVPLLPEQCMAPLRLQNQDHMKTGACQIIDASFAHCCPICHRKTRDLCHHCTDP